MSTQADHAQFVLEAILTAKVFRRQTQKIDVPSLIIWAEAYNLNREREMAVHAGFRCSQGVVADAISYYLDQIYANSTKRVTELYKEGFYDAHQAAERVIALQGGKS